MEENKFSWELFNRMPIIGILRHIPAEHIEKIAAIFQQEGLTTIEVTMNTPGAAEMIAILTKQYKKLNIGAGTVCNLDDLAMALNAGAQFIVTPVIVEEVIRECVKQNVPVFPGAFTPTEIFRAWKMGASMVKVFPAATLGPAYIKEVLSPLNEIGLVPTGGIDAHNFTAYLEAGAKAVGIGSHLFPKQMINLQDWERLHQLYAGMADRYKAFTGDKPNR